MTIESSIVSDGRLEGWHGCLILYPSRASGAVIDGRLAASLAFQSLSCRDLLLKGYISLGGSLEPLFEQNCIVKSMKLPLLSINNAVY